MSFIGHKTVSISRVQWSEMPMSKKVLLPVIFLGSNVSSMLNSIEMVAVSHNFPTCKNSLLHLCMNCVRFREFHFPCFSIWKVSFADFCVVQEVKS